MKQFTEPSLDIFALEIADIVTTSGDWAGWNLYNNGADGQTPAGDWLTE